MIMFDIIKEVNSYELASFKTLYFSIFSFHNCTGWFSMIKVHDIF